jgi:hypothetical protein
LWGELPRELFWFLSSRVPDGHYYNGFNVSPPQQVPGQTENASENEPMLYCPVCSRRLAERKCKLFCGQCGYYMSCADFY